VLPKEATNKHRESRRVKLTTFWIDDDGENYRNNSWQHDESHMRLKDTWKTRSCAAKGGQVSLKIGWISHQHFLIL
jgi:hypothetical protein